MTYDKWPMELGLIGRSLAHSFSPRYFGEKFVREGIPARYTAFELPEIGALPVLLRANPSLCGFNVTIPYKEEIIPFLDGLDEHAAVIGAVNTVIIRDGKLTGYNTDWTGFSRSLTDWLRPLPERALVLGAGGAAKAVCYALRILGIPFRIVSRTGNVEDWRFDALTAAAIKSHKLIINTTPLGTFPEVDTAPPIPYGALTPAHALYDLVYNPPETNFLARGIAQGAAAKNGYEMLVLQAEAAWDIWNAG